MKKMILAFPSKASMAEFILACTITHIESDLEQLTLTGVIPEECLEIAFNEYGAYIPGPHDFIIQ